MQWQNQTLTEETHELEAEPQNSVLDLKVCRTLLVHLSNAVADPDFDRGDP